MLNNSKIFMLCFLFLFISKRVHSQITYPDSCLKLEFYYLNKSAKSDTIKTIKLKKGLAMLNHSFFDSKIFNLVTLFRNNCNQPIGVPGEFRLGSDFWIECVRIDSNKNDSIDFNLAVDYLPGKGVSTIKVRPFKFKMLPYQFPLSLKITTAGTYKFRLQFFNGYNYIPFDKWKTYYSNWVYLKLIP